MNLQFKISETEARQAKIPHDIFLVNLIFNHILVFATILTASSLTQYIVVVPIFSILSTLFIFWGAHRAKNRYSWYVNGHWQVCVSRSKKFIFMIAVMLTVFLVVWLVSDGHLRPRHWALGGAAILPVMVTVLILIMLESESLHQAKSGILPEWILEKYPHGAPQSVI
ncbi:MAG: hypothetical protein QG652_1816 [Pseudomonadota bacterium]|nr:hypothetical protein [Pseudomonadota bacterium]